MHIFCENADVLEQNSRCFWNQQLKISNKQVLDFI